VNPHTRTLVNCQQHWRDEQNRSGRPAHPIAFTRPNPCSQ